MNHFERQQELGLSKVLDHFRFDIGQMQHFEYKAEFMRRFPEIVPSVGEKNITTFWFYENFIKAGKRIYQMTLDISEKLYQTKLKDLPADLIRLPYDSMLLEIPRKFLKMADEDGEHEIDTVYLTIRRWGDVSTLSLLLAGLDNQGDRDKDPYFYYHLTFQPGQDLESAIRNQILVSHLRGKDSLNDHLIINPYFIVNCLLYITGADCDVEYINHRSELVAKIGRCKSNRKIKKLERKMNKLPKYIVGRNIVLSREERIKYELLRNGGKHLIGGLVQGHWRNQACGPGLQERKMIWIKPFWRGPLTEVIRNRHVVK